MTEPQAARETLRPDPLTPEEMGDFAVMEEGIRRGILNRTVLLVHSFA